MLKRVLKWGPVLTVLLGIVAAIIDDAIDKSPVALICKYTLLILTAGLTVFLAFQSERYVFEFSEKDWFEDSTGFSILIPAKKHRKGQYPHVQVFRKDLDGTFSEALSPKSPDDQGNVSIGATGRFTGRIVIV